MKKLCYLVYRWVRCVYERDAPAIVWMLWRCNVCTECSWWSSRDSSCYSMCTPSPFGSSSRWVLSSRVPFCIPVLTHRPPALGLDVRLLAVWTEIVAYLAVKIICKPSTWLGFDKNFDSSKWAPRIRTVQRRSGLSGAAEQRCPQDCSAFLDLWAKWTYSCFRYSVPNGGEAGPPADATRWLRSTGSYRIYGDGLFWPD